MLYAFAISIIFSITGVLVANIDAPYDLIASFLGNGIGYYVLYRFAKFIFNINMQNNE